MKKAFFITLLSVLFSHSACDTSVLKPGCLSGIIQGTNTRVFLDCMTKDEYLNTGSSIGGIPYDNIMWTEVEDCKDCLNLDYQNL